MRWFISCFLLMGLLACLQGVVAQSSNPSNSVEEKKRVALVIGNIECLKIRSRTIKSPCRLDWALAKSNLRGLRPHLRPCQGATYQVECV